MYITILCVCSTHRSQERESDLQVIDVFQLWVLGTELVSSRRASCTLNCPAISLTT